jgi:CRP-like cAMP-binding protein/small-conductance mechanosensitive channel
MLKPLLSRKLVVVLAANVVLAVLADITLGNVAGWLATTRAAAGATLGDGLPFLQFFAFATLLQELMWRVAPTRVPRLALQIATFIIYIVLLSMSISLVFDKSLGAILGASGIVGLVLGFALRGLVSDIFSGIALQIDTSLHPGDMLEFQYRGRDLSGKLLDIAWRTVVFADNSENIVVIPNGEFATLMITNRSRPTALSEYSAVIDLGAEHDETRVLAILQNAVERARLQGVLAPGPYVRIAGVKEGVVTYRMMYNVDVSDVSPSKARHVVLGHALQFLKAAGVPVTPVRRNEIADTPPVRRSHFENAEARLAMLASVHSLSMLSPQDIVTVSREVSTARLVAGQRLIAAGEPGDSMFVVSEGSLDVVIETSDAPLTVGHLWPGDCVGEMSLFTGAPRSAHVVAREPSVTFEVRKETMSRILEQNPVLVERIAQMIAERQKANETALQRASGTVEVAAEARTLLLRIRDFFRLRPPVGTGRHERAAQAQ